MKHESARSSIRIRHVLSDVPVVTFGTLVHDPSIRSYFEFSLERVVIGMKFDVHRTISVVVEPETMFKAVEELSQSKGMVTIEEIIIF